MQFQYGLISLIFVEYFMLSLVQESKFQKTYFMIISNSTHSIKTLEVAIIKFICEKY